MKTLQLMFLLIGSSAYASVGDPLPGLTPAQLALFQQGQALFQHPFVPVEGLGPQFNANACSVCHGAPVPGGVDPTTTNNVTHFGNFSDDRFYNSFEIGGPIKQRNSIAGDPQAPNCTMAPDVVPTTPYIITSSRHTPAVLGFGLIDAIADQDILSYEGYKPWKDPSVGGVSNRDVEMEILRPFQAFSLNPSRTQPGGASRVGRFGWKAQVATLFQFSEEPFNTELGVTTPFFKREDTPTDAAVPPECAVALTEPNDSGSVASVPLYYFQALLAPAPMQRSLEADAGDLIFNLIGCAQCHRASFTTVKDYYAPMPDGTAQRVDALSNKTFYPYSDFLTHNMGESNDDHRTHGRASGLFWRTTPLWGNSLKALYWHDGSAANIDQAIGKHDGEGAHSRDLYNRLAPWEQALVDRFVESL